MGKKKENKIRPIRFEDKSVAGKKKVLQMARIKLKESTDHEYKNLFFKPDLTKKQRAEAFAKRESRRAAKVDDQGGGAVGEGEPFPGSQPN